MKKHLPIPSNFPVQPLKDDEHPKGRTTCGTCGLSWDDDIPTGWTPAPAARCPFEYFHVDEDAPSPSNKKDELVEEYVALWYGHDGILGRTIKCSSWDDAIAQCVQIAAENGEVMTSEQTKMLDETGDCRFDCGSAVHIGGLESPMEED